MSSNEESMQRTEMVCNLKLSGEKTISDREATSYVAAKMQLQLIYTKRLIMPANYCNNNYNYYYLLLILILTKQLIIDRICE